MSWNSLHKLPIAVFTYFIGYNDNDVIRPLYVRLPQMTGYAKKFNEK